MMIIMTYSAAKDRPSVKTQALTALLAIVAAVAVPQLLHLLGAALGLGSSLGERLLPMHFPVILAGLLAGPRAGAIAGLLSPAISFALSSMPTSAMLPFIAIELCVYGLCAGLFREVRIPVLAKVLIVQIAGRIVRAAAILIAVYIFGSKGVNPAVITASVVTGAIGIALQLVFIPLIVRLSSRGAKHEQ